MAAEHGALTVLVLFVHRNLFTTKSMVDITCQSINFQEKSVEDFAFSLLLHMQY